MKENILNGIKLRVKYLEIFKFKRDNRKKYKYL